MILRVAFTFSGSSTFWTGGFNYLRNAFASLREHSAAIVPILFVGPAVPAADVALLQEMLDEPIQLAHWLGARRRRWRKMRSLTLGIDTDALAVFRNERIDVVFEAGEYFGYRFPIPAVNWIADFQSHHFPHFFRRRDRWMTYAGRHFQVAGRRLIMLSSEDAQKDCLRFYPRSTNKSVVVPFAITRQKRALPTIDLLSKYGLAERFFFLPNQFWKHKNHWLIVEALSVARAHRPDLMIAASGSPSDYRHPEYFSQLQARVAELNLQESFRFLGLIPIDDVFGLMELSVGVINPSLFEGWSTTVEEAKAVGVPMVLSKLAVHVEQAGNAAIYFSPHSVEQAAEALQQQWGAAFQSVSERRAQSAEGAVRRSAEFAGRLQGAFRNAFQRFHTGKRDI
jgi:glycosyltransferase involved in cell wall biosynthesis